MNISEALNFSEQKIKVKKTPTASLDAEVLLSWVLKKPKEFLYTHPEKILTPHQVKIFKFLVDRRSKGEPIAYLINQKEFYGLNFYVNKNVLIPRPETEMIIDEVVMSLRGGRQRRTTKQSDAKRHPCLPARQAERSEGSLKGLLRSARNDSLTIADIGTGSGCIAIALKKNLSNTTIYATDISQPALTVAKKNARAYGVKINFKSGNLLKALNRRRGGATAPSAPSIDILVANLPYLDKKWVKDKSVKFEPQKALVGGENGLAIYKKLFSQIHQPNQPLLIIIELDPRNSISLKKLAEKYFSNSKIEIKKDLAGHNRILIIKKEVHGIKTPRTPLVE